MLRGNPQILNANRNNRELWQQPEAAVGVMEQNGERRWDTEGQIPQIRRASEPLPSGSCAHGVSMCEGVERPLSYPKTEEYNLQARARNFGDNSQETY